MKYLLLLLMLGCLTGCQVKPLAKAQQNYLCKEHGGVSRYVGFINSGIICRDGTFIYPWHKTIIPMEDLEEMYKIGE